MLDCQWTIIHRFLFETFRLRYTVFPFEFLCVKLCIATHPENMTATSALHILLTDHHLRRRVRRWRQDDGVRRRQRETAGGAEVGGQRGVGSKCFWVLSVCGCMSSLTLKSSSAGGQTLLTHHRLGSCHMLTHTVKQKLIRQHADEGTDILRNVQPHTCTTQTQACTCLAYNTRFLIKLNLVFHSDQTFFFFSWDIYVK